MTDRQTKLLNQALSQSLKITLKSMFCLFYESETEYKTQSQILDWLTM